MCVREQHHHRPPYTSRRGGRSREAARADMMSMGWSIEVASYATSTTASFLVHLQEALQQARLQRIRFSLRLPLSIPEQDTSQGELGQDDDAARLFTGVAPLCTDWHRTRGLTRSLAAMRQHGGRLCLSSFADRYLLSLDLKWAPQNIFARLPAPPTRCLHAFVPSHGALRVAKHAGLTQSLTQSSIMPIIQLDMETPPPLFILVGTRSLDGWQPRLTPTRPGRMSADDGHLGPMYCVGIINTICRTSKRHGPAMFHAAIVSVSVTVQPSSRRRGERAMSLRS
jgi:hypothetical protein